MESRDRIEKGVFVRPRHVSGTLPSSPCSVSRVPLRFESRVYDVSFQRTFMYTPVFQRPRGQKQDLIRLWLYW
eukprot:scaffold992_cov116-Cylindrotheca_fusiformis.AAC.19